MQVNGHALYVGKGLGLAATHIFCIFCKHQKYSGMKDRLRSVADLKWRNCTG